MSGTHSARSSVSALPNPAKLTRYAAHLTGRKRTRETVRVFGPRSAETVVSVSRELESGRRKGSEFAEEF